MGNDNHSTVFGTVGGTILAVSMNIQSADIAKTVILGIVGAITSFTVSIGLKWIRKQILEIRR
jgi:hypothetical protein